MDLSRQKLYEHIEWAKQKGTWMVISLLATATAFLLTLSLVLPALFLLQPVPYSATLVPEFQVSKGNGLKLHAVFQNLNLKGSLCNQEGYVYAGSAMSQEEFCGFKYQSIPPLKGSFDITLQGLSSIEVKYASVCLLRLPKRSTPLGPASSQQSQSQQQRTSPSEQVEPSSQERPQSSWSMLRFRHVCQKYRVYQSMRVANNLDDQSVVFLDLEIELTEKGLEEFEGGEAQLLMEEQASSLWRFVVDYYWVWGSLMGLAIALWTGFVVFVLCLSYLLRRILSEKKAEEMRLLDRLKRE